MNTKPYPLCGPLYAERDAMALGQHYVNHIHAMTREQLHSKSAIAEELAWRDQRIAELEEKLAGGVLVNGEALEELRVELMFHAAGPEEIKARTANLVVRAAMGLFEGGA